MALVVGRVYCKHGSPPCEEVQLNRSSVKTNRDSGDGCWSGVAFWDCFLVRWAYAGRATGASSAGVPAAEEEENFAVTGDASADGPAGDAHTALR